MSDHYLNDPVWQTLFAKAEQVHDLRWGREHLVFAAADAARELVSRERIEHWLVFGNLRYPQLNVTYGGDAAPVTTFTRSRPLGAHRLSGAAHADDVMAHLARGATLILSNLEHYDAPIARFCHDLGVALGASAHAYAYLTPPDRAGTRAHRDPADVFAVQIEGTKRWTLYDTPPDGDWQAGPLPADTQPTAEVVLSPGDVLYVPWGMGHRAEAGPEGSLHLTISVGAPRVSKVVDTLAAGLRSLFPGNEVLPPDAAERVEVIRAALHRVAEAVGEADAEQIAAALSRPDDWPHRPRSLAW